MSGEVGCPKRELGRVTLYLNHRSRFSVSFRLFGLTDDDGRWPTDLQHYGFLLEVPPELIGTGDNWARTRCLRFLGSLGRDGDDFALFPHSIPTAGAGYPRPSHKIPVERLFHRLDVSLGKLTVSIVSGADVDAVDKVHREAFPRMLKPLRAGSLPK